MIPPPHKPKVSYLASSMTLPDFSVFEGDECVGGLSSCFCGSLPPTSGYSIVFPFLQGLMWFTVGRSYRKVNLSSLWVGHCDQTAVPFTSAWSGWCLCPVYAARNCSGLKCWEPKKATADTAVVTSRSIWWLSELEWSTKESHPNLFKNWGMDSRTPGYFAIGMKTTWPGLPLLMTY